MDNFGHTIKSLRLKDGATQKELSKKIGITRESLAQYETGRRSPDYETVVKFANYFSVTTDYLLGNSAIPDEDMRLIQAAMKNIKNEEYIAVISDAEKNNVSPETLRKLIEIYKQK